VLAHIAGIPVEELVPLAYGVTGVGAALHVAMRRRRLKSTRARARAQAGGARAKRRAN
jgi:ribose/xylose/arabinose/galactoside ABC-type transport system permease subunit